MAIGIERKCFPKYSHNGYDFRKSITNPDSQLRMVLEILNRDRCIDRLSYYLETRAHSNGDFRWGRIVDNYRSPYHGMIRVRNGYGTAFWSALKKAGIIRLTRARSEEGYPLYVPGPNYDSFAAMANFFSKTATDRRWFYPEWEGTDIPSGWNVDGTKTFSNWRSHDVG